MLGFAARRIPSDAGSLWVPANDEVMLPFLESYGTWEPEEGRLMGKLATADMVFLDVGACFGYFTRFLAQRFPEATVHAFEPHPRMVSLLRLNTWDIAEQVQIWPTALGAERGTVGLTTAPTNIGDTRAVSDDGTFDIIAPVCPADELVKGRVDLVKIDTQGFETEVIRGMTRICQENPQIKMVVEFWPAAIAERHLRPLDVLSRYRSMGFEVCLVHSDTALPATDDEVILHATGAGVDGQATILLRRPL